MKAIVLGSTGAVGTELVKTLVELSAISDVSLLVRRGHTDATISSSPKVRQIIVDVFSPKTYEKYLSGHSLAFSTFGVGEPSKTAREEFIRVDRDCVQTFGEACKNCGIQHFTSLGAVGANGRSSVFYLKSKGQLEDALINLKFGRTTFARPSVIVTPENRYGFSQAVLLALYPLLNPLLVGKLAQFRSISVESLGRAIALNAMLPQKSEVEILTWVDFQNLNR